MVFSVPATSTVTPTSTKTEGEPQQLFEPDQIALSSDLEKELCLAINREMHVSYCYLVMSGIFTRYEVASLWSSGPRGISNFL